jgi:hypothetical protein
MSPIINLINSPSNHNNFEVFKTAIDHILSKVEFKYMEYIISESSLTDMLYKLVPLSPYTLPENYTYYQKFKQYFDYLSNIGLFNPNNGDYYLDLVHCLYAFFSEPEMMFSENEEYKKIFEYILSIVPAFKMFFSKTPISFLPFDPGYIKMAYCYGLNIHCDYITKSLPLDFWSSYKSEIFPQAEILEFLYLAGRDAMKDLLHVQLNAGILLSTLKPNEFFEFKDYIELYDSNKFNYNMISDELIEDCHKLERLFEDHEEYKFKLNFNNSKTIQSISVIMNFARLRNSLNNSLNSLNSLSNSLHPSLQLTENKLLKKYSTFPKNVAEEVRGILPAFLSEHITGIILSY